MPACAMTHDGVPAESLSTLKFANRAKRIRNQAHVNEDADQRTLLRKYEQELKRLRTELRQRQVDLVDKRQLLAVSSSFQSCQLQNQLGGLLPIQDMRSIHSSPLTSADLSYSPCGSTPLGP